MIDSQGFQIPDGNRRISNLRQYPAFSISSEIMSNNLYIMLSNITSQLLTDYFLIFMLIQLFYKIVIINLLLLLLIFLIFMFKMENNNNCL